MSSLSTPFNQMLSERGLKMFGTNVITKNHLVGAAVGVGVANVY